MTIGSLERFKDISSPKPDSSDFDPIFGAEVKKKKQQVDSFIPFITKDGDSVKVTEITEEMLEEPEEETLEAHEEPDLLRVSEEELAAIREEASRDGFEKGYAEGFAKGEAEGFAKGEKKGFAKGETEGFAKGEAEGFSKGENDGFEEGLRRAAAMTESLESVLGMMNTAYSELLRKNETFIISLICRAVEKIVYGLLVIDHLIVKRAVMEAFSLIPEPEDVTVRINTEDYEFIEHVKEDFFRNITSLKQITVIADPGVKKGGCQIECAAGEVEMDLEKRLESIKKKILEIS